MRGVCALFDIKLLVTLEPKIGAPAHYKFAGIPEGMVFRLIIWYLK